MYDGTVLVSATSSQQLQMLQSSGFDASFKVLLHLYYQLFAVF